MNQTDKILLTKRIILISGIFTALVSLLMLLNYMQIRGSEPLESKTLEVLVEKLSADPGNQELIDEIRQFDGPKSLFQQPLANPNWCLAVIDWRNCFGNCAA